MCIIMGFIQQSLPASPISDDRTPFLTKRSGHAQHRPAPQRGPSPREPEARGAQAPRRSFTRPRGERSCPRQGQDHRGLSSRPPPPGPLQARPAPALSEPRTPGPPQAGGAGPVQPVPCRRAASSAPAGRHGPPAEAAPGTAAASRSAPPSAPAPQAPPFCCRL